MRHQLMAGAHTIFSIKSNGKAYVLPDVTETSLVEESSKMCADSDASPVESIQMRHF